MITAPDSLQRCTEKMADPSPDGDRGRITAALPRHSRQSTTERDQEEALGKRRRQRAPAPAEAAWPYALVILSGDHA
jgi:hypothetical protein